MTALRHLLIGFTVIFLLFRYRAFLESLTLVTKRRHLGGYRRWASKNSHLNKTTVASPNGP